MTPKSYLNQAYRLEQRIRLDKEEIEQLQQLSVNVSSPSFEEHYNPNRNTEASFMKTLEKVWEYQDKVNRELDLYLKLKAEIRDVINEVPNVDERLVLTYRYGKNYTWTRIGEELHVDERTVRRWHNRALAHVVMPENPTDIESCRECHKMSI
jgi:DNA-directed RNA polymerase specialized sigma subunit